MDLELTNSLWGNKSPVMGYTSEKSISDSEISKLENSRTSFGNSAQKAVYNAAKNEIESLEREPIKLSRDH